MDSRPQAYDSTYVFSAEQQEEVRRIRRKYAPYGSPGGILDEEEKLKRLRRLDRSVSRRCIASALLTGTAGAVIHIAGIAALQRGFLLTGTVVAIGGLALFLAAHAVSVRAARLRRREVEPEILRLCDELTK